MCCDGNFSGALRPISARGFAGGVLAALTRNLLVASVLHPAPPMSLHDGAVRRGCHTLQYEASSLLGFRNPNQESPPRRRRMTSMPSLRKTSSKPDPRSSSWVSSTPSSASCSICSPMAIQAGKTLTAPTSAAPSAATLDTRSSFLNGTPRRSWASMLPRGRPASCPPTQQLTAHGDEHAPGNHRQAVTDASSLQASGVSRPTRTTHTSVAARSNRAGPDEGGGVLIV